MQRLTVFISLALGVSLLLAACGGASGPALEGQTGTVVSVPGGSYIDITPAELNTMLADKDSKDFLFVNVHIPYEGEIARTDLFIPFDQLAAYQSDLPDDRDARIVVYCRSGSMSGKSARELVSMGYTNVWNLDGGMRAWEQTGLPLERK